jgi:hypothetical protein
MLLVAILAVRSGAVLIVRIAGHGAVCPRRLPGPSKKAACQRRPPGVVRNSRPLSPFAIAVRPIRPPEPSTTHGRRPPPDGPSGQLPLDATVADGTLAVDTLANGRRWADSSYYGNANQKLS